MRLFTRSILVAASFHAVVACPSGYTQYDTKCYKRVDEFTLYDDCATACSNALPCIQDATEAANVATEAGSDFWVGHRQNNPTDTTGTYLEPLSCSSTFFDGDITYSIFDSLACAKYDTASDTLEKTECDGSISYACVCEVSAPTPAPTFTPVPTPQPTPQPTPEPTTSAPTITPAPTVTCPPVTGFTAVKENDDQCYYISDDAMTWNDCETSCASDLTSATMLCIEDSTQEDLLVANFGTTTSTGVWIGLQADQTSDLTSGTGWTVSGCSRIYEENPFLPYASGEQVDGSEVCHLLVTSTSSGNEGLLANELCDDGSNLRLCGCQIKSTFQPTLFPTPQPTKQPTTSSPTPQPTKQPTTSAPTPQPTKQPTTSAPTPQPTKQPTTSAPTPQPTKQPTTSAPTPQPTKQPTTSAPTPQPTKQPTTSAPTPQPTKQPTHQPSFRPSANPTPHPTAQPTPHPTARPTLHPTRDPTPFPTETPLPVCPDKSFITQFGTTAQERTYSGDVDSSDNFILAGTTYGDFADHLHCWGKSDIFIAKYSTDSTLLWAIQAGSSDTDIPLTLATDSNDNIVVGGSTRGDLAGDNEGRSDAWVSKYTSDGNLLWSQQYGTRKDDAVEAVALLSNDDIIAVGETESSLCSSSNGRDDGVVARFSSDGTMMWCVQLGTSTNDYLRAVAVDSQDNIIVGGHTRGTIGASSNGDDDFFIAKLSSSDGSVQWIQQYGSRKEDRLSAIAVDADDNIIAAGETEGDYGANNAGRWDIWFGKFTSDGDEVFVKQFGGNKQDEVADLDLDLNGNILIAGEYDRNEGWFGKYSPSGDELCSTTLPGQDWSKDEIEVIRADSYGRIYVAGDTDSEMDGHHNYGSTDSFVARYGGPNLEPEDDGTRSPTRAPTRAPTHAPTAAPTINGCDDDLYTIKLEDSAGNGWNGAYLTLKNCDGDVLGRYTLADGYSGQKGLCTSELDGLSIDASSGWWPYEVSWTVLGPDGNEIASGGANDEFSSCPCAATCGGHSCDEWDTYYGRISGQCDYYSNPLSAYGCDCTGCECNSPPSCPDDTVAAYTVKMFDSMNNGWQGAQAIVYSCTGRYVDSFSLSAGGEGTALVCMSETDGMRVSVSTGYSGWWYRRGSYQNEASWTVYDDNGQVHLSGYAPAEESSCQMVLGSTTSKL